MTQSPNLPNLIPIPLHTFEPFRFSHNVLYAKFHTRPLVTA